MTMSMMMKSYERASERRRILSSALCFSLSLSLSLSRLARRLCVSLFFFVARTTYCFPRIFFGVPFFPLHECRSVRAQGGGECV